MRALIQSLIVFFILCVGVSITAAAGPPRGPATHWAAVMNARAEMMRAQAEMMKARSSVLLAQAEARQSAAQAAILRQEVRSLALDNQLKRVDVYYQKKLARAAYLQQLRRPRKNEQPRSPSAETRLVERLASNDSQVANAKQNSL